MQKRRVLESLESLCLSKLAALLDLNDEDHDNSFNVLNALGADSLARALFNRMTQFNRSTLRHFCATSSFLQFLDISNSKITNEVTLGGGRGRGRKINFIYLK
jgi:hypothetical protein